MRTSHSDAAHSDGAHSDGAQSEEAHSVGLSLRLAPEIKALAAAQRDLAEMLAAGGCGGELRFRVELVVEEALMNLIRHGRPRRAVVTLEAGGGHACLVLRDDGPPFDPLAAPAHALGGARDGVDGGFGLHLIRRNADRAGYAREGRQNVLRLGFVPRRGRDGGPEENGGRDRD